MKTQEGSKKVNEIVFYTKKFSLPKQEEALDYIKWLWLNVGKKRNGNVKTAVLKIREIQSRHKADKDWDSVEIIREWRKKH